MTKYLVVTHEGPCLVPGGVYRRIRDRKREDAGFAAQILLMLKLNDFHTMNVEVLNDKLPEVTTLVQFEQLYIMANPPERRSIIL